MKFITFNLQLPELEKPEPKELNKLAFGLNGTQLKPPNLPTGIKLNITKLPRNLNAIMADIYDRKFDNITSLESIYCLIYKEQWDQNNPNKSRLTAYNMWQFAQTNLQLKSSLFWRLAIYYLTKDKEILAKSLVETVSNFIPQSTQDKIILKILAFFQDQKSYQPLINLCFHNEILPEDLLKLSQLPHDLKINEQHTISEKLLEYIPLEFSKRDNITENNVNLLLKCLGQMTISQEVTGVEHLLINVSPEIGIKYPNLLAWLKNNYNVTNPRWQKLSIEAKNALKKWIGAINYRDFETLIDNIITTLNLQHWQKNQLQKRKIFWSNYTDRFERIRILLPQATFQALGKLNYDDITLLIDDGSEDTEICIFDFKEWFIVEFFRGKGSETRIFPKNNEMEKLLFNSSDLSIKKIRALAISQENIHDHVYCWQSDCEKLLRSKNILPNSGITHFKITKNKPGFPYDFNSGMPPLSEKQRQDRINKLYYWKKDISEL